MTRFIYRTPGTALWWGDVAEWCRCAWQLDRRRLSRKRHRDLETHGMCLPLAMIEIENNLEAVEDALWLYKRGPTGLQRPQRGKRGEHPTTPIIMALQNRAAILRRAVDDIPQGANWRAVHDSG